MKIPQIPAPGVGRRSRSTHPEPKWRERGAWPGLWGLFLGLFILAGCGESGPPRIDPVEVEVDVRRLELGLREMGQQLNRQTFDNCDALYARHFQKDRRFLAAWIAAEPVAFFDSIPDAQIDRALAVELCQYAASPAFQELIDSVAAVYPPSYDLAAIFRAPLGRLKALMPELETPRIRTMVFGYDPGRGWEEPYALDRVFADRGWLGIGLEYFAGADFPILHPALPMYLRRRGTKTFLPVTALLAYAETLLPPQPPQAPFLDQMLYEGLKLHFVDRLLPDVPDSVKMYYSPEQMAWARSTIGPVYKKFVPLLYETRYTRFRRYLGDGPHITGLGVDKAPPRLGAYIGWQIVRAYFRNRPGQALGAVMKRPDYRNILQEANFRP